MNPELRGKQDAPSRDRAAENPFYDRETVASATECTGLMPALPDTEAENESFAALYAVHKAEAPKREMYKAR